MKRRESLACCVEQLESRQFLSVSFGGTEAYVAAAKGGKPPAPPPPPIRLDLVAVHEFGHSLGLGHSSDPNSIMYAYYNANYNLNNFASDPAVAEFRTMYSADKVAGEATPWKDALDGADDGHLTITYSFVQDGARLDAGKTSTLISTFNTKFPEQDWKGVFVNALNAWANVSDNLLSFRAIDADGVENNVYNFNAYGEVQNDPNMGDIRIGAHKFDGAGKVLAHTYLPPPNGITAAGDAHFDIAEAWDLTVSRYTSTPVEGGLVVTTAPVTEAAAAQSPFTSARQIEDNDDVFAAEDLVLA